MKYLILSVIILSGTFTYSQEGVDSSVLLLPIKNGELNFFLKIAKVTSSKDTIYLKNLSANKYTFYKSGGQTSFHIDNTGLITGTSLITTTTNNLFDSTVIVSKSSIIQRMEKFINGKPSFSAIYESNRIISKRYDNDGSYFIQLDTLINKTTQSIRTYYQNNGIKYIVYDGIKNVDTTFSLDGNIMVIESRKNKFKKTYNLFGNLETHSYIKHTNKKGSYEDIMDYYKYGKLYKRIVKNSTDNTTTTIYFKEGGSEIAKTEVIAVSQKGDIIETVRTVLDDKGKVISKDKTNKSAKSESVESINNL